jgi:quinol-cytochrome oxidoreductase complex cytochrome b subunit
LRYVFSFYPYFASKDVFAFSCFLVFFAIFVFYFPNTLNHPDNYIPADPLETPAHVVPEWYECEVFRMFEEKFFIKFLKT